MQTPLKLIDTQIIAYSLVSHCFSDSCLLLRSILISKRGQEPQEKYWHTYLHRKKFEHISDLTHFEELHRHQPPTLTLSSYQLS